MDGKSILIIEDDADIRESIRIMLESEGYYVEEADTGESGLGKVTENTQLVILDIMLPGISGYKVCEMIRKKSVVPILFLTAKSEESDKVFGFAAGGDDYLVKPFSYVELVTRIKALIRRNNEYNKGRDLPGNDRGKWIDHGKIRINCGRNEVFCSEQEVFLTEMEYEILLLLVQNPEQVFSVQELYEEVWNEVYHTDSSNTVMVHIRRLRKKIEEDPQKPRVIVTVWGKGYKIG